MIDKAPGFLILVFRGGFRENQRRPFANVKPLLKYFTDARIELSKVTWPTRRQTARLTALVIVFSLVFAAILGGLDLVFSGLVQKVIVKG